MRAAWPPCLRSGEGDRRCLTHCLKLDTMVSAAWIGFVGYVLREGVRVEGIEDKRVAELDATWVSKGDEARA